MTQDVEFHIEGVPLPVKHALQAGTGVVVGRAPEPVRQALQAAPECVTTLGALTFSAPAVSSAHACVTKASDGHVVVRDLDSTNETWVMLARGQSLTVDTGGAPLRVAVGMGGPSWRLHEDPPPPVWAKRKDYPEAMRDAVASWAKDNGIPAMPTVSQTAPSPTNPDLSWFPLREGWGLRLGATRPTFALDDRVAQRLHAWVRAQNELYDCRVRAERGGLVMESEAMREAWRATLLASKHDFRLLLTGPSGSGKSTLADVYHQTWNAEAPMVKVNCSQFGADANLNHSILFGIAPGALPNTPRNGKPGYVGEADGGTIFFDEIADLPLDTQANLLTFLDRGLYRPLGGEERSAVVRVVSATNKDVRALIQQGKFRADLWYRLRGAEVALTAMNDRPEDVAMFLQRMDQSYEREVIAILSPEAHAMLLAQPWHGGFRDISNVVQQLFLFKTLRRATRIGPDMVHEAITSASATKVVTKRALPTAAPVAPASSPSGQPTVDPQWRAVADEALRWSFHEGPRDLRYPVLNEFINQYLKPTFVAHACGLANTRTPPTNVTPEALGQKIGLGRDTVPIQLRRYCSRP